MSQFRIMFRFLLQLCVLLGLLFLEYPFGAPLFTVTVFIFWFSSQSWLQRFVMSVCLSLACALILSLSWLGTLTFFVVSLWLVRKSVSLGWPQLIAKILIVLLAIAIWFVTDRVTTTIVWQAIWTLLIMTLFSKTSRRHMRHVWQQRRSRSIEL